MKWKILLIFLLILISLPNVLGKEWVGISLDCYEECAGKEIHYEDDLILTLSIANNLNFWISIGKEEEWGGVDLYINAENNNLENGKGSRLYNDFVGQVYYIPPNSKLNVYLPYDVYNNLDKDKRLGNWELTPELRINDPKFYKNNPFDSKETSLREAGKGFSLESKIVGNPLSFKVTKPEVNIGVIDKIRNNPLLKLILGSTILTLLFVTIVGGIIVGLILWKIKGK